MAKQITPQRKKLLDVISNEGPIQQGMAVEQTRYVSVSVADLMATAQEIPDHPVAKVYLKALATNIKNGIESNVFIDAIDLQAMLENRQSVEVFTKKDNRVVKEKVLV
jgi:hypothetical protein